MSLHLIPFNNVLASLHRDQDTCIRRATKTKKDAYKILHTITVYLTQISNPIERIEMLAKIRALLSTHVHAQFLG